MNSPFHAIRWRVGIVSAMMSAACDAPAMHGPTPGLYTRSSAHVSFQGKTAAIKHGENIEEGLPLSVRVEPKGTYEVDARLARVRGTYRIERDSLFLDEIAGTSTRVALAGRAFGDTLELRLIGAAIALGGPPGLELVMRFTRGNP